MTDGSSLTDAHADATAQPVTLSSALPLTWKHPDKPVHAITDGLVHIHVCRKARDAVVAEHLAQHRAHRHDLDADVGLNRLKAAAALALFASRYSITERDWNPSGPPHARSSASHPRERHGRDVVRTLRTRPNPALPGQVAGHLCAATGTRGERVGEPAPTCAGRGASSWADRQC